MVMGIIAFLFLSPTFERVAPKVLVEKEIYWNLQKPIKVELPSQETLDYFVKVYKLSTEEKPSAEFIKYYEKDGRTYVIIQVNNKVCDLPLLKTSNGWTANGVSCK